jgi:hypothetical protein
MRSCLIMTVLVATACNEGGIKEEGQCESSMSPYSTEPPALIRYPQTVDLDGPNIIDSFEHELHVAPWGSNSWAGTEDAPLSSIEEARLRVQTLLDGSGHIAVWFHDGMYPIRETVVFGPEDSGAEDQVIRYGAWGDAEPTFHALVPIEGWVSFQGPILKAPLPDGTTAPRFLWDSDSGWLSRSSTDMFMTDEYSEIDEGCLECNWDTAFAQSARLNTHYPNSFDSPDWSKADQYDLRQSTISWVQEILPLSHVDEEAQRIFTTIPASLEMRLNFEEAEMLNRNWVLNTLEGINEPGEWAVLDGWVYLYPTNDSLDIRVPTLTELLRVDDGTEDGNAEVFNPVSNIQFTGLHFTGGDFYVMQADDITVQHDWSVVDSPTSLLRIRNAKQIIVSGGSFTKSGGTGVRLDRYAQEIDIVDNRFDQLGRSAIVLSGRGPGYGDVNTGNTITYNHISRTGLEKWAAPAIVVDQSSSNLIHHNLITDTQFTAIALTAPRQLAFASLFEGNEASYLGREFHYKEVSRQTRELMANYEDASCASYASMQDVYNMDNVVELNTLIDVGQGAGYLVNGYVYVSAVPLGGSNTISFNYIHDTDDNIRNNSAIYSDSDQDYAVIIGNMISGLQNGSGATESMPIFLLFAQYAEGEINHGSRIVALGNAVVDSTYEDLSDKQNAELKGTITDTTAGIDEYEDIYSTMMAILLTDELPRSGVLPGEARMLEGIGY